MCALQAIAMGKQIYAPVQTAFNAAASTTAESFAAAQGERTTAAAALEIEASLSRQTPPSPPSPLLLIQSQTSWSRKENRAAESICLARTPRAVS